MFQEVLFPSEGMNQDTSDNAADLTLSKLLRYTPSGDLLISQVPLVIFDFETTGLDPREDRIIELGAQKVVAGQVVDEISTLIYPEREISDQISKITGITNDMLKHQPKIAEVLPKFLQFMEGCILVAHNAEFDMAFLSQSAQRLGYQINWPSFCTLKLSRILLPQLESRSLDGLAAHYQLTFEARHRSVGDVKVTRSVLTHLLTHEGAHLQTWKHINTVAGIVEYQ